MAESKFTDEVLEVMEAEAPLNWSKANAIGAQFNLKPRAVVASAIRAGIEYNKIVRVSKTGGKIESKADLVAKIAARLGVSLDSLDGLDKATKTSLQVIAGE